MARTRTTFPHRILLDSLESRLLLSQTPLPITVSFSNTTISSETTPGQTAPSFSTGTDFRYASTTAPNAIAAITRTFTITNTSNATLNFGNVTLSGSNAADFSITSTLPASLAANSPANLTIAFTPSATGTRTATLTIPGTTENDQPFLFDIQGTGLATTNLPDGLEIGTTQSGTGNASAVNGDILQMSYSGYLFNGSLFDATSLHNNTPLTVRLDNATNHPYLYNDQYYSSSYDFPVIDGWEEGLQGMKLGESRVLIIPSSLGYGHTGSPPTIPADAPLLFETTLNQLYYSPQIGVTGNSTYIAPNSTSPNTTDGTDFGSLPQGQTSITRNFTLNDYSSADNANGTPIDGLTFSGLSGFSFSGTNASDFSISQVQGQNGVYAITFNPTGLGLRSATVHVHSNDLSFPDYSFAIQGTNPRAFSISANSLTIPSGSTNPSSDNFTDFSYQSTSFSDPDTRTFTITNTGTGNLTLGNISFAGANPSDFTISSPPAKSSLAPNESTSFSVQFNPTTTGTRAAIVSIATDDPTGPYSFAIDGTGVATTSTTGGIQVATIQSGNANVTAVNGDILQIAYTGRFLTGGSFTGTTAFRLDNATGHPYVANDQSDASTKNAYDSVQIDGFENGLQGIKPGESRLLFLPASQTTGATANGSLLPAEPLLYLVTCTGLSYSPQISITGNSISIPNGAANPNTADGTDFGTLTGTQQSVSHTFDLLDNSAADDASGNILHNLSFAGASAITFTGPNAADFSAAAVPDQPGLYTITYQPTGNASLSTATVHFPSNDPLNPDYTFTIQGANNASPDLQLTLGTPTLPAGQVPTNTNKSVSLPITITNIGAAAAAASPTSDIQIFAHNTITGASTLLLSTSVPVSLTLNGSVSYTFSPLIPLTLPTGTYSLLATINQSNAIADPNPTNNSATTSQTFSVLAVYNNLTAHILSSTLPKSLLAKTPIAGNITFNIVNAGTLPLSKTQQATVTLLAHNTATNVETPLLTLPPQSLSLLKPGANIKITTPIKLPAGLPAATYSFVARIAPTPKLAESSTTDNSIASTFTLTVYPPTYDLTGTLLSSTLKSSPKGVAGNLALTLRSLGNVNLAANQQAQLQIIAHPTTALNTASDIILTTTTVKLANLAPQSPINFNLPINYTKPLHAGTYQIEVRIVTTPHLAETNTLNNLLTQKALILLA
ncbi:MAG TPA: choice-of-anchor D domain-containing protein [Phycisphaerae bacterium]|nr:choice-of-anchor D domain-containing protein [Phycisphaerae bacterium]